MSEEKNDLRSEEHKGEEQNKHWETNTRCACVEINDNLI